MIFWNSIISVFSVCDARYFTPSRFWAYDDGLSQLYLDILIKNFSDLCKWKNILLKTKNCEEFYPF